MESEYVREYVGRSVKIDLENGFYYKGKIISVGNESLVIKDINGNKVILALKIIVELKEVEE